MQSKSINDRGNKDHSIESVGRNQATLVQSRDSTDTGIMLERYEPATNFHGSTNLNMHEGHTEAKKKKKRKQRGNEIDRQDEGDWVVSRPTSLTPIEECLVGSDEGRRVAGGNRAALTDYREG